MTFDEFFKKKRIDLVALEKGDGRLFSEFKTHFEQMGEKSFDHTKKYWFNKLRHEFPLAPEVKTEKVKIDNPLAQQTVTEALAEAIEAPAPKLGFTPKFKSAPPAQTLADDDKPPVATPKPAFTPRFKPGVTKPVAENKAIEEASPANEAPSTGAAPKIGFTPKFKAGITKQAPEEQPAQPTTGEQPAAEAGAPKLGFKPKFKAGITKPATDAEPTPPATTEDKAEEPKPANVTQSVPPKLGFKPKFKAANIPKTAAGETPALSEPEKQSDETDIDAPGSEPKAPQLYKPRFNMKNMPPKGE